MGWSASSSGWALGRARWRGHSISWGIAIVSDPDGARETPEEVVRVLAGVHRRVEVELAARARQRAAPAHLVQAQRQPAEAREARLQPLRLGLTSGPSPTTLRVATRS